MIEADLDRLRSLARAAVGLSSADQTEAAILAGRWALTRFANSSIHQNMASENAVMRVRAVFGKKVASAGSNRLDEQGIASLVGSAVEMARLADENPDFRSLPGPEDGAPYTEAVAIDHNPSLSQQARADSGAARADERKPEDRAEAVRAVVEEADRVGGTAAGSLFVRAYERAVANSLGIDSCYRGSSASLVTVVTGPEGGFGYASATAGDVLKIDARAVGREAAERAEASRNPGEIAPGEYECVLLPYAVADMIRMLAWAGFGALAYQENRSFVSGKLGSKIVGDAISIRDDGLDPRTIVEPFDMEGVAKKRVDLITSGVVAGVLYDSYTAHREGKRSTGHALGGEYELGGSTGNLILGSGDASVEEMIASTKRGILVTRFHYTNIAHLMTATITGMTRDGTFLIENGRLSRPLRNMRFTQSVIEALSNVEMVGNNLKLDDGILAPALKVGKFRFSSATEF